MSFSLSDIQVGLSEFCATAFPSRERTRVCDVTRIGEGWESEICGFRMEYEQAGKRMSEDLVLRIYQGDRAAQKAAREFNGMRRLHQEGFPVPKVWQLATENSPFGKPFVIMERIEGRTMADILAESPQARMLRLLSWFCGMFVQLHALDWRPFASDPTPYETVGPVNDWLSRRRGFLNQLQVDAFDPVLDWLAEHRSEVPSERLAVIHGDYHPYNVLVRDDGAAFVVDWTNIRVSDLRFDLAWTLLLTGTYAGSEIRQLILDGYERIAGRRVEHIEYFEVAACLSRLSTILVSLTAGATALGMRPGAEAIIKRDAGHTRRVYALLQERTGIAIPAMERLLASLS